VVADKHDAFVVTLDASPRRACPAAPAPRPRVPASTGCTVGSDAKIAVSVKPDASLDELAAWISGLTCKPVSFDPSIATRAIRVSLIVASRITAKQAGQLFADAMESAGLAAAEHADGFEVKPGPSRAHCAAPAATAAAVPAPAAGDPDAIPDAAILKIDDTHYEVQRALVDRIAADPDPASYLKGMRIVPSMRSGVPDGFKLYAIRPNSLYGRLGLANGDTIRTFAGVVLDSPDSLGEGLRRVPKLGRVELELSRRGQSMTLEYLIVK
jgi:hypothetical protein